MHHGEVRREATVQAAADVLRRGWSERPLCPPCLPSLSTGWCKLWGQCVHCGQPRSRGPWRPHLELAQGVAAVQVLMAPVHLQCVVFGSLSQGLAEHCGLLPEGTGHQCQGHVLGGHLEGEALLGGGGGGGQAFGLEAPWALGAQRQPPPLNRAPTHAGTRRVLIDSTDNDQRTHPGLLVACALEGAGLSPAHTLALARVPHEAVGRRGVMGPMEHHRRRPPADSACGWAHLTALELDID